MARSAVLAVAVVVLLAFAGATPAASDGTQPNGEWGIGQRGVEQSGVGLATDGAGTSDETAIDETTTGVSETTTARTERTTTAETEKTSDATRETVESRTETVESEGVESETGEIETEGFDPDYDPSEVLRRVEAFRGLSATEKITLHEYDEARHATHDAQDRFAAIRPAGARTLQLFSNASTERRQPLGYTVQRDDGVHVYLMNASDVAEYGVTQEAVLAHEFVHALQFQHDLLTPSRAGLRSQFQHWTTDTRLVATALVEGDAMWVTEEYLDRYGRGNYSVADYNRSLARAAWPHSVAGLPYYYGYRFYEETGSSPEERTEALARPPNSTAELLHPNGSVEFAPLPDAPDVADDGLTQYHSDTVGELVVRHALRVNGFSFTRSAEIAEGWANDRMYYYVPENGTAPTTHWVTVWENDSEAREFADGWRSMLRENGAQAVGDALRVPASDEAPAVYYVIEQEGDVVRITAAPRQELAERLVEAT